MKKYTIATIASTLLLLSIVLYWIITVFYPKTFIVAEIHCPTDTLILVDSEGNEWLYSGIEDYEEGDMLSAIMYNKRTPDTIYDDEIVRIQYSGFNMVTDNS